MNTYRPSKFTWFLSFSSQIVTVCSFTTLEVPREGNCTILDSLYKFAYCKVRIALWIEWYQKPKWLPSVWIFLLHLWTLLRLTLALLRALARIRKSLLWKTPVKRRWFVYPLSLPLHLKAFWQDQTHEWKAGTLAVYQADITTTRKIRIYTSIDFPRVKVKKNSSLERNEFIWLAENILHRDLTIVFVQPTFLVDWKHTTITFQQLFQRKFAPRSLNLGHQYVQGNAKLVSQTQKTHRCIKLPLKVVLKSWLKVT